MAKEGMPSGAAQGVDIKEKKGIQSVEVGVRVVDALARAAGSLPLRDIGRLAGISASQAHRYLTSFQKSGLVVQDPATGHYGLGTLALRWGVSAMRQTDLFTLSSEALDRVCERFDATGLLCIWGEYGPTCVRLKRSTFLIGTDLGLGSVFPVLSSASGYAFLAFLPRGLTEPLVRLERERAHKRGEKPVSLSELKQMSDDTRRLGYALVRGHYVKNLSALAAPILDYQGNVCSMITLIFRDEPGEVMSPNVVAMIEALVEETRAVSRSVGWLEPAEAAVRPAASAARRRTRKAGV